MTAALKVAHPVMLRAIAAAHRAVPQSAGAADGADEKQDQHAADGSRRELQQAAAAQGRLCQVLLGHNAFVIHTWAKPVYTKQWNA
jgi:hypothetical protein